jgi:hypothetical protein
LGALDFRRLTKIFYELKDHQEVFNLHIPWHNWLVLGSESPNIFCFALFGLQFYFFPENMILTISGKTGKTGKTQKQKQMSILRKIHKI